MLSSKAGGGGGWNFSTQIIGMFHSGFKNKPVFGEKQALTFFFFFFQSNLMHLNQTTSDIQNLLTSVQESEKKPFLEEKKAFSLGGLKILKYLCT